MPRHAPSRPGPPSPRKGAQPPRQAAAPRPAPPGGRPIDADVVAWAEGLDVVARAGTQPWYLQGALPGERVRILPEEGGRAHRAVLDRVVRASPDRVAPPCPHAASCSGCDLQHTRPAYQARFKLHLAQAALRTLTGGNDALLRPTLSPESPEGQRTKIGYRFAGAGPTLKLGLFAAHTRDVAGIDACIAHDAAGERLARAVLDAARGAGVEAFDERRRSGWLRSVVVRVAQGTRQAMVTLVVTSERTEWLSPMVTAAMAAGAHSVAVSVHRGDARSVSGARARVVAGAPDLVAQVGGLRYAVSPGAFFQTSHFGAEALLSVVREAAAEVAAGPDAGVAWDLYGGAGFFATALAADGWRCTVVEESADAIADARATQRRWPTGSIETFVGRVAGALRPSGALDRRHCDLAVLDPPRSGCEPEVVERLARQATPRRIILVSCDLAAAARDGADLLAAGYRLTRAIPIDMFPWTRHLELVSVFDAPATLLAGRRRRP
jgi:23S rRNA (uracil1939-C5)-methyltransferase